MKYKQYSKFRDSGVERLGKIHSEWKAKCTKICYRINEILNNDLLRAFTIVIPLLQEQ